MAFYSTVLLVAVVIMLNSVVYALTDRFGLYLYAPETDDEPISSNGEYIFSAAMAAGKTVTVTFCQSEEDVKVHDTGSFVYNTAVAMAEAYPELIELRYVNAITGFDQDGRYVDLTEYKTDMRGEKTSINSYSVIFECDGNYRVLSDTTGVGYASFYTLDERGYIYAYNGEEVLTAMICWVTVNQHGTVYFTQNHSETADPSLANLFAAAGYYVDLINLRTTEVPEDASLVVISAPTSDFEESATEEVHSELDRLRTYLDKGGNVYVNLDPFVSELKNLESFLAEYGISYSYHTAESGAVVRDMVCDDINAITTDGYAFVAEYGEGNISRSISSLMNSYVSGRVLLHNAASLKLTGGAEPLLISSDTARTVAGGRTTDSSGGYTVAAYSTVKNDLGDVGYVVVIPTTYVTSTEAVTTNGYTNKEYVYSLCYTLFDSTALPMGCKTVLYTSTVLENLTMGSARLYMAIILALPVALAVTGTVVLIRRKNR